MCLKSFVVGEFKKIFGGTEEMACATLKKSFIVLGAYALLLLMTVGLTTLCATYHLYALAGLFSFMFSMELWIISILISLFVFAVFAYYAAFFAHKGWRRDKE